MYLRPLRLAAIAVGACTAVATVLPAEAVADIASPQVRAHARAHATAAAHWQASQLVKGRIRTSGFDDWGLTIDSAFALVADGTQPRRLRRVTTAIENNYFRHYAVYQGDKSAGAMSKSLLAARVLGRDARHFGGHNVRAQVLHLVAKRRAGFESGRVRDTSSTDYSNTLSQSYAVLGLARTGGVPQRAVAYLLKQQCSKGFFRTFETAGQTCNQGSGKPDVDATSLAIQALVAARRSGAGIAHHAITRAARWLVSRQGANGGFGGGGVTSAENANSTGVAAQALVATHHPRARAHASAYVARLQITRSRAGQGPARRDRGAVAYNRAALRTALRHGVTSNTRDQFRRATAQAIFGFVSIPLSTLRRR
jgi:hypothetical protein